ncbi:MAG: HAD family hydrolase [Clostridia bacterium]|nr:HAD family hydrolase [Clostridia bacterium]
MRYDYIFWDWNGTLLDDAEASRLAVNAMLAHRGLPPIDMKVYRERVATPIRLFYEKTFDMSNENMDDLGVEFNSLYVSLLGDDPLRAGAREVLADLRSKGVKQYVFSASAKAIIDSVMKKTGIAPLFDHIIGSEDFYVGSKTDRTLRFIRDNGIDASRALFVGDAEHDLEVARECGGDCVFISGGHRSAGDLSAHGRVVDSLYEIADIVLM